MASLRVVGRDRSPSRLTYSRRETLRTEADPQGMRTVLHSCAGPWRRKRPLRNKEGMGIRLPVQGGVLELPHPSGNVSQ